MGVAVWFESLRFIENCFISQMTIHDGFFFCFTIKGITLDVSFHVISR